MELFTNVFSYLAECGGIPLWVLDANGKIIYSSIETGKLKENANEFLKHFCVDESETPQIRRLDENELFAEFRFRSQGEVGSLIAGPAYETHPYRKSANKAVSVNFLLKYEEVKSALLKMPAVSATEFCRYVSVLASVLGGAVYRTDELMGVIREQTLAGVVNKQLVELIFDMREDERITVYAPDEERKLLSYVEKGDVDAVRHFRMPTVKDANAEHTRYQSLFEAVALVTLATRAAMNGGLDYVVAFSLSDLYFKQLSQNVTERELSDITKQVLMHFTQKVRELNGETERAYSPYIAHCIRYIRAHLHYTISLEEVAKELSINPKYLSRLFIANQGEKFSSFVQRERIMEAKNLLDDTDRSIIDISHALGFSSQSYFIKVFSRYVGMSPGQYLDKKKHNRSR